MFIDMHCDTILKLYHDPTASLRTNKFQIDLNRMKSSLISLQNFALFIDIDDVPDAYTHYQELFAIYQEQLALNNDLIQPIYRFSDFDKNTQSGQLSAMLTLEEGAPLEGRIDRLEKIYQDGVRMITLTWNKENELGYPNALYTDEHSRLLPIKQQGLKLAGREVVERMNELGIIVDVSHGSDQLVLDVLETSSVPFVASHSNSRALCSHARNLPDELIRLLAERGCLVGLNYCDGFIRFDDFYSLPQQLAKHAAHLRNVGGLEILGLGSDFDGIPVNQELADILSVEKIVDALQKEGFTSREIDFIGYKNATRLYKDTLSY